MKCTRQALRLVAATLMWVPLSFGQATPEVKEKDWVSVESVQLTHADAHVMARVIDELGFEVAVVAAPNGQILVRGMKAELARALEVIGQLDTPGASATAGVRAVVIPIGDVRTKTLLPAVEALITGSQSRFALDSNNRMLIVRASDEEIAAVQDFLARVENPLGSATVELYFLRAMIGATGGDHDRDLPSALAPIAKALFDTGFSHVSLMAPIRLKCRMGREFFTNSRLRTKPGDGRELGDDLEFKVRGGVRATAVADTVELTVSAEIGGHLIDADMMEAGDVDFGVSATIAANFGQFVILSAGPSSTANGQAVAVVVRVTRDSSQ